MQVAVIGAGIAGISAAWHLQQQAKDSRYQVSLYEAGPRLGGHTDTHAIWLGGRTYNVDSGFIVYNELNYPGFASWLKQLQVPTQASDMSFALSDIHTGVEYGTRSLGTLFCQRRNLLSPGFLRMLWDIRRFYRQAPMLLTADDSARHPPAPSDLKLGDYLAQEQFGQRFIEDHLLPMCGAIWSLPRQAVMAMPVHYLVRFMQQHHLLQVRGRPRWRVISGGSASYLRAFSASFQGEVLLGTPVLQVRRLAQGVEITTASGKRQFDALVLACHSDDALALLADASSAEQRILGAIRYQSNRVLVHSDPALMPRNPKAWSSWNALVGGRGQQHYSLTYWMNLLQGIQGPQPFFVTLNPIAAQIPKQIWAERHYRHPVFTPEAVAAQQRLHEIQGQRHTYYAGAYWGWGFHEDGFQSGQRAAASLRLLTEQAYAA